MTRIFKNLLISLTFFFLILKPCYSIDELDAIKYIENVGQKAIDILKTPIKTNKLKSIFSLNRSFIPKVLAPNRAGIDK